MNSTKIISEFKLTREEPLLLIIDVQERLAPAMQNNEKTIKNIKILIETAKKMDIPMIVTEQYPKGLGSTISEIKDILAGVEQVSIHEKIEFSACSEDVLNTLKKYNKNKIIVVGMETHVCVFQTIRDLLANRYQVFAVADGVDSRYNHNYLNGLELIKEMGATVTNTETIVFDLLQKAGTDEFKYLSKLIK